MFAVIAAITLAAACGGSHAQAGAGKAGNTATGSLSVRACPKAADIGVFNGFDGAAAGTVSLYVMFFNETGSTCYLTGWPSVRARDAAGRWTTAKRVSAADTIAGGYAHARVVLHPDQHADAVILAGDNPAAAATSCPPSYRWLQVSAPGSPAAMKLNAWLPADATYLPACAGLHVSNVVPASALPNG